MERKMVIKDALVKVTDIIKLTNNSSAIRFERPAGFDYFAGQFIMLCVELNESETFKINGGKSNLQKRAYSMSSSPTACDFIETTVKETPGGFMSKYLVREMKVGNNVKVTGPLGLFYYAKEMGNNIVLLGGGSGITPLLGILRYIKDSRLKTRATLIYSNKTEQDIIWSKELEELSKQENISVVNTLTRVSKSEWGGELGRIDRKKIETYVDDYKSAVYYVCGSNDFVDHCIGVLSGMGIPNERIKREKYG